MKTIIQWSGVTARHAIRRSCLCFLLLLIMGQAAQAQLGRGPKRGDSSSTTATGAAGPKASKEAPLHLIAAEYVPSLNVNFDTELAFRGFLERLQESGFLTVSAEKDVRPKEAIDLAKKGIDAYVGWMQLEVDLMGAHDAEKDSEKAAVSPVNPACLYISYAIFAPGTGKAIAQGHVYQPGYQDRCVGGVYHPSPYPDRPLPTRAPPEVTIKQAGRDAADRVMTALDITLPSKHP